MNHYLLLVLGLACAAAGGELFVRGAAGFGLWLRVPVGLVGATFAAFATSSPEMAVGVKSGIAGVPEIALGDALGSNVVNVALILGLGLLLQGIRVDAETVRRDFAFAAGVPVLVGALGWDGWIGRGDAVVLLGAFAVWLGWIVRSALRQRGPSEEVKTSGMQVLFFSLAGMALLVAAGHCIVEGAKTIALRAGLDEFIVGATIVAIATSMPELATTLVAQWRKHHSLGLGNILGSNIFNCLIIVSIAALVQPIRVSWESVAIGLGFGVATVLATWPRADGWLGRGRGVLLLAFYAAYLAAILTSGSS